MVIRYNTENDNPDKVLKKIEKLQGDFTIVIEKIEKAKSPSQMRYYWLILKIIGIHTGIKKEDLHYEYGKMFNPKVMVLPNDEILILPQSTKQLEKHDFQNYIQKVKHHAIEFHNCEIPDRRDKSYERWVQIDISYKKNFSIL